jgi:PadR family transcriptional regulator, regulatory protein PadR
MGTNELLPGTLDLLVLKTLSRGALHGYGIAQYVAAASEDALRVGEGSLYPALQRLVANGWAEAEWKLSDTGRRARYYRLTAAGRKQLRQEENEFARMVGAIRMVLEAS